MANDVEMELKVLEDMLKLKGLVADDLVTQVAIKNSNEVLLYAADIQNKVSSLPQTLTDNVKLRDVEQIGWILEELVRQIVDFIPDADKPKKGLWGLLKGRKGGAEKLAEQYSQVSKQIDKIVQDLEKSKLQMLKDIVSREQTFEENVQLIREISLYIAAGEQKINEWRQGTNEQRDLADRMEQRINDLQVTKTITMQTMVHLQHMNKHDKKLLEEIQYTLQNTISIWKKQIVLALKKAYTQAENKQVDIAIKDSSQEAIATIKKLACYNENEKRIATEEHSKSFEL